jgi:hypothetical protein
MKNKSSMGLRKAAAALLVLIAGGSGCQQPTQVAAKSPTPVRVVDVALNSSSESLRYSASVLPLAQAALSFKSSGYVTEIKQVMGADGRRREIGAGDYVARATLLAQIRHEDLRNQLDQAAAAVTQAEAQHLQASQDYERARIWARPFPASSWLAISNSEIWRRPELSRSLSLTPARSK